MSEAITLLEKVIEQFEPLTEEQEELISQIADYLESQYGAQEGLLEALDTLTGMAECFSSELHKDHPDVVRAREVIAKAKGEPL